MGIMIHISFIKVNTFEKHTKILKNWTLGLIQLYKTDI